MQLLDEAIALALVHDEGEVQVIRRLAHQIDLLLFEELEGAAELVQDRADVAAYQAHGGARPDHLHAAQPRQAGNEFAQQRVVERVGGGVE